MDYLDIDFNQTIDSFMSEMKNGLSGKKSSLDMIATYIEVGLEVPTNKPVIVIDAGGTNFRVAVVRFDEQKKPVITNMSLYKMPGVEKEIGKVDFFKTMAGYLRDVVSASSNIGFCFSYPVGMLPYKDGKLIRFSKEIKAKEVIGELIGENLNRALVSIGLAGGKHIVLLNDTVVTLLAGIGYKNRIYSSYVGFILGTGTNVCYIEKNSNIKKLKTLDKSKSQIINVESGNFNKIKQGKIDVSFDKKTINPKVQTFEKMISGAYLGPLFLENIHKACDAKLFSKDVSNALQGITSLDTIDMNAFMVFPYGNDNLANICKQGKIEDTLTLYYLADHLVERAAKLAAIDLSAMAIKSETGFDPTKPICIVAEGTTFYQMKTLKSRVDFYLKQYLENKMGIYYDIISVDNATLIGSAIAGLTN